ncbi:hypothetical protein SYNTR_1580 [Candidatus Syntrophocurvum alkaliphilum]|uniref:Uncharacterized protein n=1 Tax=Candidatus Syntrophocurvum alkaliphilum TaxID=2293317 RepID=A0A6I6DJ88_9FIRM|nr:DUF2007 domain-containing protein [Candidatus Syntrophocurvum alkaliphilum]QGU00174.1 hypothetical protein SYNTR_1580 [Candidatus Syntrophocurvum alkaliphilum]
MKNNKWEFLKSVVSIDEYNLIANILDEEGIPVMRKTPGAGAYLEVFMGSAINTRIDIYVPSSKLEQAIEILTHMEHGDELNGDIYLEIEEDKYDYNYNSSRMDYSEEIKTEEDKSSVYLKLFLIFLFIVFFGSYILDIIP